MFIEKILEFSTYFIAIFFLTYLILNCIGLPKRKQKDDKKSPLYYPSITENSVKAKDVFQTLKQNNIKPNYLGMEGK